MGAFGGNCRVGVVLFFSAWITLAALNRLVRPVPNGCVMTYMYPTYIPISTPKNVSSDRYGLFLYHEGWKQIDFDEHIRNLDGIPVLFIPGNGGSYKQVRSLAAESFRAYQNGPLEPTFYREASSTLSVDELEDFLVPSRYGCMLDWFAVDLEGEHSAMDGRILEEHTEYVVYAIHRILDQYKESHLARSKDGVQSSGNVPSSVILVGHSMGGFVARAALVHTGLRKSAVETILTLSSPHQYPPIALQPSLGQFFSYVNEEWRNGYKTGVSQKSSAKLSNVVIVSVSGGIHDYQITSRLASLDGIVPSTHGFMVGSSSMTNVWLSMEHQSILWCNQLVVQVSHTLLSMIDPVNGHPFLSPQKRVFVFAKMLQSAVPQSLSWMTHVSSSQSSNFLASDNRDASELQRNDSLSCPTSVQWTSDGLEKDLHVQSNLVTVLAMDGRRRWLDIKKMGLNGRGHFAFVTNLAPCSGVRIHLWPEKHHSFIQNEVPASKKIVEVTSKMVQIPAGPAPKQVEPGSQTEQPPPSAFLLLSPEEMSDFHFMTISVAHRPMISGRPPPVASMAVGQFFNPEEGTSTLSVGRIVRSSYAPEEIFLTEDHPLALNMSFSVSLGLLPVILSLRTAGCGIRNTGDQMEAEKNKLCKLRCFPPVALAWDSVSGLHIIPNIYSETLVVDSSPATWDSHQGTEKTTVLVLADPHCSYKVSLRASLSAAASRFFLLYSSEASSGFTLLDIIHSLILSPIHSFYRFIYSVLPRGDEDLKGNEAEAIIKFKRALGLNDVDAANMHIEIGRRIYRERLQTRGHDADMEQQWAFPKLIYVSNLVFGDAPAFPLPWKLLFGVTDSQIDIAMRENAKSLYSSQLKSIGRGLDIGTLIEVRRAQLAYKLSDEIAAEMFRDHAKNLVQENISSALDILKSHTKAASRLTQVVEEVKSILSFNSLLTILGKHPQGDRFARGLGPISLGGEYDHDRRADDLKLLYRAYATEVLSDGRLDDEKLVPLNELRNIFGLGKREAEGIISDAKSQVYSESMQK